MASTHVPSLFHRRPMPWAKFIALSAALHGLVLSLFVLLALFRDNKPRVDLNQKPITASLVRLGKERDQKLLPRLEEELPPPVPEPEAPPPPPPPSEPKAAPKVAPLPVPLPLPLDKKESPPKEKKTEQPLTAQKQAERRKQLFDAFGKVGKPKPQEEREGRKDGDLLGNARLQEGERYFGLLRAQVERHYDVSNSIPEQERIQLKAVALIQIGDQGQLLNSELVEKSGNRVFDAAVLAAISKSAPFAVPPAHLRDLTRQGISIAFTP